MVVQNVALAWLISSFSVISLLYVNSNLMVNKHSKNYKGDANLKCQEDKVGFYGSNIESR